MKVEEHRAHPYTQAKKISCPSCGNVFSFEVWLIVNSAERPDLLDRVHDGTLHRVTCPECSAVIGEIDAPLLLFHPDEVPPLLLFPAAQATEQHSQSQAAELIDRLQHTLGAAWRDEWLEQGLTVVAGTNQLVDEQQLTELEQLCQEVVSFHEQGLNEQALQRALYTFELARKTVSDDHPDYTLSLNILGEMYYYNGQYSKAEPLYLEALEIRRRVLGVNHLDYALSLNNLSTLYEAIGRYDDAVPLQQQAVEIRGRLLGKDNPVYTTSLNNLAALYKSMGRNDEAESLYLEAQEIWRRNKVTDHPDYALILNNLATLYQSMDRNDKAESLYLEAQEIWQCNELADHPNYALSLNNLAALYKSMDRNDAAEPLYLEALEIRRRVLGEDHPDYLDSLLGLAELYRSMGRNDEAEPLYRQAQEIRRRVSDEDHPRYANKSSLDAAELFETLAKESLTGERLDQVLDMVETLSEDAEQMETVSQLYSKAIFHVDIETVISEAHLCRIVEIARALDKRGDHEVCGELLEPTLNLSSKLGGNDAEIHKVLLYEYAENLRVREHHIEAVHFFSELNQTAIRTDSLSDIYPGHFYKNFGLALVRTRFHRAARRQLNLAQEFYSKAGDTAGALSEIREGLAEVAYAEGDRASVLALFEESLAPDGSAAIGPGLLGMTALSMPSDGSFRYSDAVRSNVQSAIDHIFETGSESQPFAYQQLKYLFLAAFDDLLERPDGRRFADLVERFTHLVSQRLVFLANRASQSSVLALTQDVSSMLDRVLSYVVEHKMHDRSCLLKLMALGQVTKGALTRLLRGRRYGSPTRHWIGSLRDWYQNTQWDEKFSVAKFNFELDPTTERLYYLEYLDRALSEKMNLVNAYRYLSPRTRCPEEGTITLEYFAFDRHRPGQSDVAPEPWIVSILHWLPVGAAATQDSQSSEAGELLFSDHDAVYPLKRSIDELRNTLHLSMQMGTGFDWRGKATYLGRKLLPHFPEIPDRPRLIVIPDAHLHLVPFDVLTTNLGAALADQYQLSFAQSSLDILDLYFVRAATGLMPVCIGDPDFNLADAICCSDDDVMDPRVEAIWRASGEHPLAALDTDEQGSEVEKVASILGVQGLTGAEATATELLRVNAPAVIHLSTHGFYLRLEQIGETEGNTSGSAQESDDELSMSELFLNPQNRSGLAFAGANLHFEGKRGHPILRDGFVFAADIESLDLRFTELVSLSACVTGVGDEVEGDGIAGVRRAFFAAGAESVVSTIWDVPVDSTREFFVCFYRGLQSGMSRAAAFEVAKKTIAEAYPGEAYRYCGFQLHGATGPIHYFADPDVRLTETRTTLEDLRRLLHPKDSEEIERNLASADELDATVNEEQESRFDPFGYREFIGELERLNINLEASDWSGNRWLRMAYRSGIWSIGALRALLEDESIPSADRKKLATLLNRIRWQLGC